MVHRENQPLRLAITDCRLDRQSFVPLYRQIKDLVLDRIEHGDLATGDLIPSETQLGAAFKVSRLTVRQALYELRVEGYIIREKCRGTLLEGLQPRCMLSETAKCASSKTEGRGMSACDKSPMHSSRSGWFS